MLFENENNFSSLTCALFWLVCRESEMHLLGFLGNGTQEWQFFIGGKEFKSAWYKGWCHWGVRLGPGENDDPDVLLHLTFAKILGEKYLQKLSGK